MGTFTLHADFREIDGGATQTQEVYIAANAQVLGTGGVIFDAATVPLVAGVLTAVLPADDHEPNEFGYIITRTSGRTRSWSVPVQAAAVTVELADFTSTASLPVPDVPVETVNGEGGPNVVLSAADVGAQPLDSDLTAIAATLTTAYGRAFLALADQAALMALVPSSSATVEGKVELATAGETTTGTDTTKAVTPAGVQAAVDALIASAPGALNTLDELAAALGDDANFAATVTATLAGKQPSDGTLTALAALTVAANKLVYATGADAFTTTDLTAWARTLLDDADAAAGRGTLGLGTAATHAHGDYEVAGAAAAATAFVGCKAVRTATQSIAASTIVPIQFNAADEYDTNSLHDPATNPSRITADRTGKWLLILSGSRYAATNTGDRLAGFMKNGALGSAYTLTAFGSTGLDPVINYTEVWDLAAGDYVEAWTLQASGGTINMTPDARCTFAATYLGA